MICCSVNRRRNFGTQPLAQEKPMDSFQAYRVQKNDAGEAIAEWQTCPMQKPDAGEVVVKVTYSSINYKDFLAATGHPGVAKNLPLIPGIDAVGEVTESRSVEFQPGDPVLIAHADFGTAKDGGFAQYIRVPASYVYRLADNLAPQQAAAWGTAGFTAAQSVRALIKHGIQPEDGPIVVSGATGGVGVFAIKILASLGYQVVASTGKSDRNDWLKSLGASEVVGRDTICDPSSRPLLKGVYAAAIDQVGGTTLATLLRMVQPHGCVTACGLVGGHELATTVYPFILRGVALLGIDSANITYQQRQENWEYIATAFGSLGLDDLVTTMARQQLADGIQQIAAGNVAGRIVIEM